MSCKKQGDVAAAPPVAAFSYWQDSGNPLIVKFLNESENAMAYTWDFGNQKDSSRERNPVYTFSKAGTYKVTLNAENSAGTGDVAEQEVVIDIPKVRFGFEVDGFNVKFSDSSENLSSYKWDFGDSTTSTEKNPQHTYKKRDVYNVRLTGVTELGKTMYYDTLVDATQAPFTKVAWSDEFDYTGLPDPDKWGYETGYLRNNELQYYANARLENSRVEKGHLYITARKDNAGLDGEIREITSASINTNGKYKWKYGKIEVRAKVPVALGSWPAIWMLNPAVGWPDGGEIDIMEQVGFEPNNFHFNVHTKKYNGMNGQGSKGKSVELSERADERFHVFALHWYANRLEWHLDGKKVFEFLNEGTIDAWPFEQDFYIILNLAFGGDWAGGAGVDKDALPLEYAIDYVRVYQ